MVRLASDERIAADATEQRRLVRMHPNVRIACPLDRKGVALVDLDALERFIPDLESRIRDEEVDHFGWKLSWGPKPNERWKWMYRAKPPVSLGHPPLVSESLSVIVRKMHAAEVGRGSPAREVVL